MESKALIVKHQLASIDIKEDQFLPPGIVFIMGKTHTCVFNLNTGGCHVMENFVSGKALFKGIKPDFLNRDEE